MSAVMRSQTMDPSNKTLIYGQLMTMHTSQLNYDHTGIHSPNSQFLQCEHGHFFLLVTAQEINSFYY